MPQQKSSATMLVADGQGGLRTVDDHRFDAGDWPISFAVPPKRATPWMEHLEAECESRGWASGGMTQLEPAQNSGSMTLRAAPIGPSAVIEIAWEKQRNEELLVRARVSGNTAPATDEAREFFAAVDARLKNRSTFRAHRRAWLTYDVLPWRGELWLDREFRLGPPSKHPDALFGPQVVVVDAMVEGIGSRGVTAQFQRTLFELRVFLSVVLGGHFDEVKWPRGWACESNEGGQIIECRLTTLGYVEIQDSPGFPSVGAAPPIERRAVSRPGIGKLGVTIGICADMSERWVPDDIEQLWASFSSLPSDKRDHFIKAGNAYLIAQAMWPEQRTAYASFLVVACEALKPPGRRHRRANIYDVVESLCGSGEGDRLRSLSVAPQKVRSEHFHRGDLLAGELGPLLISDPFQDPSFREMLDALATGTRVCLIEWLRRKGAYSLVRLPRVNERGPWTTRIRYLLRQLLS